MKSVSHFIFIACLAASCSSMQQPKEDSIIDGIPSYHYKTYKITSTKTIDQQEGIDTTYFVATYPEFSNEQINQYVLHNLVLDSGKSSLEQMGKEFIKDYDNFYDQAEFKRTWFQEKRDSVVIQTKSYIGFSTFFYSYTGGAHGNYYTWYHNYNVEAHQEISLTAIVAVENQEKLRNIAEAIFRKQENLSATESFGDDYFFEDNKFYLPDNFILQKTGLLFLYTIYEIKPYVAGETKLVVPYSSIQALLTSEGGKLIAEIQ